jgi:hypothetical protein
MVVGEVIGKMGAHGTAVAKSSGHGFGRSGNDEFAVMFDLKTFKPLTRISAWEAADAVVYDAPGTLTVIYQDTPDQNYVLQTVQMPSASRNMGLDPVNHRVYIVSGKFGPPPTTGRGWGPVPPGSFSSMVIER